MNKYEEDIKVILKDSSSHQYLGKEFKVSQDTLFISSPSQEVAGCEMIKHPSVKIPIKDIDYLEVEYSNGLKTILLIVGVTVVLLVALGISMKSSYGSQH